MLNRLWCLAFPAAKVMGLLTVTVLGCEPPLTLFTVFWSGPATSSPPVFVRVRAPDMPPPRQSSLPVPAMVAVPSRLPCVAKRNEVVVPVTNSVPASAVGSATVNRPPPLMVLPLNELGGPPTSWSSEPLATEAVPPLAW